MNDTFGNAGRTGRIHDVERMSEGQPDKLHLTDRRVGCDKIGEGNGFGEAFGQRIDFCVQIRNQHESLYAGQLGHEFGQFRRHIDRFTVVPIAVAGNQHLRFSLTEAIQHALNTKIRRSAGKYRPQAGSGQHRNQRFRQIGQVSGHSITGNDADIAQRGGELGDVLA